MIHFIYSQFNCHIAQRITRISQYQSTLVLVTNNFWLFLLHTFLGLITLVVKFRAFELWNHFTALKFFKPEWETTENLMMTRKKKSKCFSLKRESYFGFLFHTQLTLDTLTVMVNLYSSIVTCSKRTGMRFCCCFCLVWCVVEVVPFLFFFYISIRSGINKQLTFSHAGRVPEGKGLLTLEG